MTKQKSKRLLSLLLSLAMVSAMFVTPAFAISSSAAVTGSEVMADDSTTSEIYAESGSVASVSAEGKTTVNYSTFAEAFAAANSGDTITLNDDVTITDGSYSANGLYQVKTDVTIDLNNHTLTADSTRVFGVQDGGSLTVKNGTVKIADNATATGNQFNILRGTCSFTAENVTFDSNNIAANFLHVASGGTATIALTDCDITNQSGGVVVYDSDGNSTVSLTGCNYEKNPSGGALNDITKFKIVFNSNNPITSESTNWEASNSLRYTYVVADGGSVSADLTLAKTKGAASLTVEGGSVTGTVTVAEGTSMTVSGGTVTGSITTNGTFTMTGGTVIAAADSSQAVFVKGGTVNISGGTIDAKTSRALVFNTDAEVSGSVSGGTFIGNDIALLARSSDSNTVSITGGTYTASKGIDLVDSILAEGYSVYDTAGNAAKVSGNYYMSTLEDQTVIIANIVLGISDDSSKVVFAEVVSGYGESTMYVKVSAANMSNYSTSSYPTTDLAYTPTSSVDSGKYIFAGWYTLAEDGSYTAMTSFPTGEAYAKFVDANALSVSCFFTPYDNKNALRFFTSQTDVLSNAGFDLYINDTLVDGAITSVQYYTSSYSVGGTQDSPLQTYTPASFSSASTAVVTGRYYDTSKATTFSVVPYWVTKDGTKICGEKVNYTCSDITSACVLTPSDTAVEN